MSKKKTYICSLSVIIFFMILSCENTMTDADSRGKLNNSYTVTYYANGGIGEMKSSVFTVGAWGNLPPNTFTREGYVFTGWAISADGDIKYTDKATVKDIADSGETITLYAKWGVNVYTVVYVANGGEGSIAPDVFKLGWSHALAANTFTRKGYTFEGWSFSADGDVEHDDKAEVQDLSITAGDMVMLYAVWKGITYIIEYKANGGYGNMANSNFTYGELQELRPNAFLLDDYVFAGWSVSEAEDIVYANEDSVFNLTDISGDIITLYAKWGKNIFTVSYVANGGSGYMAPGIVTIGQEYTLIANTFTKEGYFFIGWSLLNNGEVHLEDGSIIENTEDITGKTIRFYAVWLPEMVITWPVVMYAVYGQNLSDLWILDDAYTKIPGTFTWTSPDDPVGNVGKRSHRIIFTPEDTVHYNVVIKDMEIIVYPKFVKIAGTQSRTLIPYDSGDTLYGKTTTLEITLDGLLNGDTVTLTHGEGYGLSLSGNTGIGNNTRRTINVSYDGTVKINDGDPMKSALYISGNNNYILDITSGFKIAILDGQTESRAIPVIQTDMETFNSYVNTKDGLTRHYKLVQNITNHTGKWEPIGTNDAPFTGSFNGSGFTISNITINKTTTYQGIFGYIGAGGVIKNTGLVNCNTSGGNYTGGVTGYNNGIIQNCYVTGNVSGGTYTGGVAGQNINTVQNCYTTGRINGTNYIGGIVGYNTGTIKNSTALNSIITTGGSTNIGRVAGSVSGSGMSNNYARNDMAVKYNWNGSNGTTKTISAGLTTVDGSNITTAQWKDSNWWQTTTNWNTTGSASVWDFTSIWAMNVNNLPKFKTASGVQNHVPCVYSDLVNNHRQRRWLECGL